jgi:predicted nuclease of predicted toxin-antitoxin system
MKFKLDENFGTRTQQAFRAAGHEVHTVRDEGLEGSPDQRLYEICISEQCCLVTFDLDFADTLRFPPATTSGIVVIRLPRTPSIALLEQLILQFIQALAQMPIEHQLWIVEVGRIRIHKSELET